MNPYEFEEACEAYRKAWLHEVAIYVALMLISGTIGYFFWCCIMLMRSAHNCKTTFVNGVNPFITAAAFAPVPEPTPQEPKGEQCYGNQPTLQVAIFALLADGKPRKALDIALEIDRKHKSVENKLWELAKSGVICSTLESRACVRPVPFYSIWGTE